jgi:uncharacterized membrane protein YphA (DoxX/SURF4 family)
MQADGVDGQLLPLVILTEPCGSALVLFGFKTRWAAIALFGFCLLTGAFFHTAPNRISPWPAAFSLWRYSALERGRSAVRGASRLARADAEALSRSRTVSD